MAERIGHLPPGHEPGSQSRRGGRWYKRMIAAPLQRDTKGVSLQVEPTDVRRGDKVRVTLTLAPGTDDSALQIGLVCTQFTDVKHVAYNQNGQYTERIIEPYDVVADWKDVQHGTPMQTFDFTVPDDGPFSYEGATVSWAYKVSARRPKEHRIDPHHDVPFWVRP